MAFWSSEKLSEELAESPLISAHQLKRIKHGAYELSLGGETIITPCSDQNATTFWKADHKVVIPPGQMAMLITEETVDVPLTAMALISMKAGKKLGGLINISGFHVDPGFKGKLKFSVYNAGSRDAVLEVGRPTFLIWFCDLDRKTEDGYNGDSQGQDGFTAKDASLLRGEVASPGAMKKQLDELRLDFKKQFDGLRQENERRISSCEDRFVVRHGTSASILLVVFAALMGILLNNQLQARDSKETPANVQIVTSTVASTSKDTSASENEKASNVGQSNPALEKACGEREKNGNSSEEDE